MKEAMYPETCAGYISPMSGYVSNNLHSVKTDIAEFMLEQRNVGFEPNDGQWILYQSSELYWSSCGVLITRRAGKRLGIFADLDMAQKAIESAEVQPLIDEPVRSIGRASC